MLDLARQNNCPCFIALEFRAHCLRHFYSTPHARASVEHCTFCVYGAPTRWPFRKSCRYSHGGASALTDIPASKSQVEMTLLTKVVSFYVYKIDQYSPPLSLQTRRRGGKHRGVCGCGCRACIVGLPTIVCTLMAAPRLCLSCFRALPSAIACVVARPLWGY